jgi:hypothetical protein
VTQLARRDPRLVRISVGVRRGQLRRFGGRSKRASGLSSRPRDKARSKRLSIQRALDCRPILSGPA